MTEQEQLIQDIRERLGEMPKGALPFDLLAFTTTIGQRYSMTEDKIMPLVMKEAEALGVNYRIGSSSRGKPWFSTGRTLPSLKPIPESGTGQTNSS